MNNMPLDNVRFLSVREIAEMWPRHEGVPRSMVLRELRVALLTLARRDNRLKPLDPFPPDDELPDPETLVDQNWLEDFCMKQGWERPEFWFGKMRETERYAGRPSLKRPIRHELEARAARGELHETLAAEARSLLEWAEKTYPGERGLPATERSVENQIREKYRELKASSVPQVS